MTTAVRKQNGKVKRSTKRPELAERPMHIDAIRLRERMKKRRVTKEMIERALTALRGLQFDTGKKTNSVKLIRRLR